MNMGVEKYDCAVMHITGEVAPFSQTGGLGDVTRDLPAVQRRYGQRSVVVSPLYGCIDRNDLILDEPPLEVALGDRCFFVRKWRDADDDHWFIDAPNLIDRPTPYNDEHGEYWDNPLRFAVFCKAAVMLSDPFDCLHLHDWQAGLAAIYNERKKPILMSVHNLAYQGLCDFHWASQLEIPDFLHGADGVEYYGNISLLKAGLSLADQISTVSPTYGREIQSEPGGQGLSGLFTYRSRELFGILNGLDYELWDPETDPALEQNFNASTLSQREVNRSALLSECELTDGVLFSIVSRAASQKGLHLIAEEIDELVYRGCRFVFLANGDPDIMLMLKACEDKHPNFVRLIPQFDPNLARRLYSGSDFVVVPSLFEPCGLTQMMAMRYGSVPVVRKTGGLADTVTHGKTGITFNEMSSIQCREAILKAVELYRDTARYVEMQQTCMLTDYSWDRTQQAYTDLYLRMRDAHEGKAGSHPENG